MGTAVGYSAATMCRVSAGRTVPSLEATLAFVHACGGDEKLWKSQHRRLSTAVENGTEVDFIPFDDVFDRLPLRSEKLAMQQMLEAITRPQGGRSDPLSIWMQFLSHVHKPGQFALQMRLIRKASGMTLREISDRTAWAFIQTVTGRDHIPVSTLSDLCNPRHRRLPTAETLEGFLLAVEVKWEIRKFWLETRRVLEVAQETDQNSWGAGVARALQSVAAMVATNPETLRESPIGRDSVRVFMHVTGR